jgi:mono/diheme cytochrome c family protein
MAAVYRAGGVMEDPMFTRCLTAVAGVALLSAASVCTAQIESADLGRLEYEGNCASCHGLRGKGDGPMKAHLVTAPSDLTTLTKRSGGAFPSQLVWEVIDGRTSPAIGGHGTRDMPVWGWVFRSQAQQYPGMAMQPEWYVRGRIVALLDYLNRLQVR